MIPRINMSAEQLYHAFTVIPRMRYRVVVYAEQRVNEQWIRMSSTELATFATRIEIPGIVILGCPADLLRLPQQQQQRTKWCRKDLRLPQQHQQQRNKWCPPPLQRSFLKPPRMPQEPCDPLGDHGKPG
jgi:hypothetical protein